MGQQSIHWIYYDPVHYMECSNSSMTSMQFSLTAMEVIPHISSLSLRQYTLAGPVCTGILLVDPAYTMTPLGDPANTCGVRWKTTVKKLNETASHWNATGKTELKLSHTGMPQEWSSVATIPVWDAKIAGHHAASGQVSVNSACTWSLLVCNSHQFGSSYMRVLQHHSMHAFDMSTITVFVYLGLQFKWNQLSSNNSRHTNCIHMWFDAGKWHDLLTSKPEVVSTLGYHWADYTGTTQADAISRWSSSGNPELICIIVTHWKTTGATGTLGCHWNHTGWY